MEKEVEKMPRAELVRLDCTHFEPYLGKLFERSVSDQERFLVRHLHVGAPMPESSATGAGSGPAPQSAAT